MTEKQLTGLLAKKEAAAPRQNVSLVLSPEITRNAMRLKKRRQDRIQAVLCCAAAIVFALASAGIMLYIRKSENPEELMRPILMWAAGGMGMTLLLSPALAWFCTPEEERKNEA